MSRESVFLSKPESSRVSELTLAGQFWGSDGAIALSRARARHSVGRGKKQESRIQLASTYYAAAGNAKARGDRSKSWEKKLWHFRASRCLLSALLIAVQCRFFADEELTANQLDILSRILFKAGAKKAALRCVMEGLDKADSPETTVLLYMGLAEIREAMGDMSAASRDYELGMRHVDKVRPLTQVRFYKSLGAYYLRRWRENITGCADLSSNGLEIAVINSCLSEKHLMEAMAIATKNGLQDQVEKIRPLLNELGLA